MRSTLARLAILSALVTAGCSSTRGESDAPAAPKERDGKAAAHELTVARGELRVAELDRESKLAEAQSAVAFAQEDLVAARRALEAFKTVERPHAEGDSKLDIDQAKNRLLDAEAELAELESMYENDDFAEKTKELVLARGRRALEVAKRALALAELEHQNLVGQELPEKERELARALAEAELAAVEARRGLEKATLEGDLGVTKAKHELETKEKEHAEGDGEAKEEKE